IRLSDVLLSAGHGLVEITAGQALQVTREVLAGLAVLHDSRNVTHGSLGPERIVLTPHGRAMAVEHVLAQALEKLQLPRHQLWRQWRIPTPPAAGPVRFDARTDLAQAGLLVLALVLGRLLEAEEYPHRLRGLLPAASARLGRSTGAAQARELHAWLERLLPIESRRPFTTVKEAQLAFEALISAPAASLGMSPAKVRGLVSECVALGSPASGPDTSSTDAAASEPAASETSAPPVVVAGAGETSADAEVDVEALLRLAAELEAAGGEPAAVSSPAPDADAPEEPAPRAAIELVHDEPQVEPTAADVVAAALEVDLAEPLALMTESRPAEAAAWHV